jgi:hypothetical protein
VEALKDIRGSQAIDTGSPGKAMNQITQINCPRCNVPMKHAVDVDQNHIGFETCGQCKGIYLDAGEFRDLKSYTIIDYVRGLVSSLKRKK